MPCPVILPSVVECLVYYDRLPPDPYRGVQLRSSYSSGKLGSNYSSVIDCLVHQVDYLEWDWDELVLLVSSSNKTLVSRVDLTCVAALAVLGGYTGLEEALLGLGVGVVQVIDLDLGEAQVILEVIPAVYVEDLEHDSSTGNPWPLRSPIRIFLAE